MAVLHRSGDGGLSTGDVSFALEDGQSCARITGRVSTANRGGSIQMRLDLVRRPPEGTTGVRLVVRGNTQRYFVYLRTGGKLLPWKYDQAGFEVLESWERCGPALYFLLYTGRTRPTNLML
ncbi:CIA30 family protein [Yoonia vestfoldensis]|uniref:CIA30 family protein n=1 Tax=Yoonia vestfoldensis TaxID=245188 RepID=UPI001FE0C823|nr:CIA30 family protein [Yoonia vestfoldensis]